MLHLGIVSVSVAKFPAKENKGSLKGQFFWQCFACINITEQTFLVHSVYKEDAACSPFGQFNGQVM